jgi:hypothetical protein
MFLLVKITIDLCGRIENIDKVTIMPNLNLNRKESKLSENFVSARSLEI